MNQELRIMVIKNKVKSIIHDSLFIIHSKGFTLIELLIAIAIIAIMTSFLIANFAGVRQRARDGVRKSDLRQIQAAVELYRSDQGKYPFPSISPCGSSINVGSVVYMAKIPCDPNTSPVTSYEYSSSAGETYCVRTCLENVNDVDRDEIKYLGDNPTITGCSTLSACDTNIQRSYTLQNP